MLQCNQSHVQYPLHQGFLGHNCISATECHSLPSSFVIDPLMFGQLVGGFVACRVLKSAYGRILLQLKHEVVLPECRVCLLLLLHQSHTCTPAAFYDKIVGMLSINISKSPGNFFRLTFCFDQAACKICYMHAFVLHLGVVAGPSGVFFHCFQGLKSAMCMVDFFPLLFHQSQDRLQPLG